MISQLSLPLFLLLLATVSMVTSQQPEQTSCACPCQGIAGPQGVAGPPGAAGPAGAPGVTGPQGLTGPAGDPGQHGVPGQVGGQGLKGEKGDQGSGQPGSTGSKGETGPIGAPGLQGSTGKVGPQGIKGESGASGVRGQQGVKGDKGQAGTYTTPPMSAFTVTRKNSFYVSSGSQVISFETEDLDINSDMDHTSGIFTCTIPGYYYFSFSFLPKQGHPLHIYLEQNGSRKIKLYCEADTDKTNGRYSTKTIGITLQLEEGDEVKLKAISETYLTNTGYAYSVFTGFLVHAI